MENRIYRFLLLKKLILQRDLWGRTPDLPGVRLNDIKEVTASPYSKISGVSLSQ
jgi:hypothetical protein